MTEMYSPKSTESTSNTPGASPTLEVRFYKHDEPFGCFTNFSAHPIVVQERTWATVEHYFQAQKFAGTDPSAVERIMGVSEPKEAAKIGRDRSLKLRSDWEEVKHDVMRIGIISKLLQHAEVLDMLRGTGSAVMIEASPKDDYWGTGANGDGKNMLGKIYMEIRHLFSPESSITPEVYLETLLAKTTPA